MKSLTTPGLYFESLQPLQITGDLLRSDITAFIGYAAKGPTDLPVRVESWSQFIALFGEPMTFGYLSFSVKSFFENGGVTCYVLRIADRNALPAQLELNSIDGSKNWRVQASFKPGDIIANEESGASRSDTAVLQNIAADAMTTPLDNPGSWGNSLWLSISKSSRLSSKIETIEEQGFATRLTNVHGLENYSVVELSQEKISIDGKIERIKRNIKIESIDYPSRKVLWKESLLDSSEPFDPLIPIKLDTQEFDIQVGFENRIIEEFKELSPHPLHQKSLHHYITQNSQMISFEYSDMTTIDWYDSTFWPEPIIQQPLQSGKDGLSQIDSSTYIDAIEKIAKVDEVCIVCVPDLVYQSPLNKKKPVPVLVAKTNCYSLNPPDSGLVFGLVNDGLNPLANVFVTDAATGKTVKSNRKGHFTIEAVDISLRTLRFEKSGFEPAEIQLFSVQNKPLEPVTFSLAPLAIPRTLPLQEILEVQSAMLNPVILGKYKFALLDPPSPSLKTDEIRNWRSQVGDSDSGAIFYPWLATPSLNIQESEVSFIPPCGHISGVLAKMDLLEGPHRSPANIRIRFAKGLSQVVEERQHGVFNSESINVVRSLPGQGIRLLGSRSLSSSAEWRYFNVRRLVFALEKTLEQTLQWAVFESNTSILRQAVVLAISTLLQRLWLSGALAGKTANAAFQVKCDFDNNPQSQREQGKLLAEIAIAPSIPFEFIKIRFGKTLDAIEVTE